MQSLNHTNFIDAFIPGTIFISANQGEIPCHVIAAGELVVISGKILACDPDWIHYQDHTPFQRRIQPGKYPVFLSIATIQSKDGTSENVVAAAKIQFNSQPIQNWEIALLSQPDIRPLKSDYFCGYGVDSGIGCFVDTCTLEKFSSDELKALIEEELFTSNIHNHHKDFVIDLETNANLIAFTSGYGEDIYASYWGLTGTGEVGCLVTDFRVLVQFLYRQVSIPNILQYMNKQIEHGELKKLAIEMRLRQETPEWVTRQMRRFGTFNFSPEENLTQPQKTLIPSIDHHPSIYEFGIEGFSESAIDEITIQNGTKNYLAYQQFYSQNYWYLQFNLEEPLQPNATILIQVNEGVVQLFS